MKTQRELETFINLLGVETSLDNPDVFVSLETIKRIVADYKNTTVEDLENNLRQEGSRLYEKIYILGYYNGKKIYRSTLSKEYNDIVKKIFSKLNISLNDNPELLDMFIELFKVVEKERLSGKLQVI